MTTKFLDKKIGTFKFLLSWHFPRETAFLDNSPPYPRDQPPQTANFVFVVVSQSLSLENHGLKREMRRALCQFAELYSKTRLVCFGTQRVG